MRYIGQGSEITVTMPSPLDEAGVRARVRGGLQGAVRPHAAGRRDPVRGAPPLGHGADAGHAAASSSCRAMPRPMREKGTRPVFFPDENKTIQTKVWDRYALAPGVKIEGPAVFEEDESTFIVGPGATARSAGRRLHPGGGSMTDGAPRHDDLRSHRARAAVAAADLGRRRGRGRDGAHQLLDPGARELRFLLRHHRRRPASRWCRRRRASRASSARCPRR